MKPTRILILLSMVFFVLLLFVSAAAAEPRGMVVGAGKAVGPDTATMDFRIRAFAPGSGELWMHVEGASRYAGTHTAQITQVGVQTIPGEGLAVVYFTFVESTDPGLVGVPGAMEVQEVQDHGAPQEAIFFLYEAFFGWWEVTSGHIAIR
jgi:hypothetical protein